MQDYKEKRTMRSDLIFGALTHVTNRYQLVPVGLEGDAQAAQAKHAPAGYHQRGAGPLQGHRADGRRHLEFRLEKIHAEISRSAAQLSARLPFRFRKRCSKNDLALHPVRSARNRSFPAHPFHGPHALRFKYSLRHAASRLRFDSTFPPTLSQLHYPEKEIP